MDSAHWTLIAYDIRGPARLRKLHRYLRTEAYPIQASVFAWYGNQAARLALQARILTLIDEAEDDVRGYRLRVSDTIQIWGQSPFADGVFDSGYPPHTQRLITGRQRPAQVERPRADDGAVA